MSNDPVKPASNNFTNSGNITGANINVGSTLDGVIQNISGLPGGSQSEKEQLASLLEQLQKQLQKVPSENKVDAETVAERAESLVKEATKAKVDEEEVKIRGESLKRAAQNIATVLPTVFSIATQIVSKITKYS